MRPPRTRVWHRIEFLSLSDHWSEWPHCPVVFVSQVQHLSCRKSLILNGLLLTKGSCSIGYSRGLNMWSLLSSRFQAFECISMTFWAMIKHFSSSWLFCSSSPWSAIYSSLFLNHQLSTFRISSVLWLVYQCRFIPGEFGWMWFQCRLVSK